MAWPRCPECSARVDVRERRNVLADAVTVVRAYLCACGWSGWSEETIVCTRPESLAIRRKFGTDVPPVGHGALTRGSKA